MLTRAQRLKRTDRLARHPYHRYQEYAKRGLIGRKIIADVLELQKALHISDSDLAERAKISPMTIYGWRVKLNEGQLLFPQYPTIEVVLNAMEHTLTQTRRNYMEE